MSGESIMWPSLKDAPNKKFPENQILVINEGTWNTEGLNNNNTCNVMVYNTSCTIPTTLLTNKAIHTFNQGFKIVLFYMDRYLLGGRTNSVDNSSQT